MSGVLIWLTANMLAFGLKPNNLAKLLNCLLLRFPIANGITRFSAVPVRAPIKATVWDRWIDVVGFDLHRRNVVSWGTSFR